MAVDVTEVAAHQEVHEDGSPGQYGRVWYQGKQVRRDTYAKATGVPSSPSPSLLPAAAAPNVEPPAVAGDGLTDEFASFFGQLAAAGNDQKRRDQALDGIEGALGKLQPGDYPALAENPVVLKLMGLIQEKRERQGERTPGMVVGEGLAREDIPWRMEDVMLRALDPNHPQHPDFVLQEWSGEGPTTYVGWNGLGVWLLHERPSLVPKAFLEVVRESNKQRRAAEQHRDYLFAPRSMEGGRVGASTVAADPTIMAGPGGVTSRMLRGAFAGGNVNNGGGLDIVVPDADRPGFEPGDGSDEQAAA